MAVDQRLYFFTYLIPASMSESEAGSVKEAVELLVKKHKGKVVKTDEWGKKRLAYKIKHTGQWLTEAYYVHLTLDLAATETAAFERNIYLQPQIMRHLLTVTEESTLEKKAPLAEATAQA